MKLRLTDLAVRKLSLPASGQVTHWDETTPGFGVRCSAKSKSYVIMYGERRRLKTLGRYPSLSLADARKRAKEFQVIQLSVDPSATNYEYEAVRDAYLEDCTRRLRASTLEGYMLYLQNITFQGPIKEIARGDVLKEIQAYTKSASSQNYAFTTFKVFFNWAVRQQYLRDKPAWRIETP